MNNKKKIILSVLVVLLILAIGVTYAFFTYENGTKSEIVTGQIYMNYEETNTISLTGVFPETKEQALARQDENGVFEFTITGRNTSNKPIYYEIDLLEGGLIAGATEQSTKILPEHVRIYLERDGEVLIDGKKYNDWDNRRVFVETIPANQTSNIEHKYTLRMWIDENVTISDTAPNADYTTSEWNNSYTSLQVRVVGDLTPKELPGPMARLGTSVMNFWSDNIINVRSSIEIVNFIKLDNSEIDTRYNAATIKSDVTTSQEYPVKVWLEENETDTVKYTMYVASEEIIYFPSDSSWMFYNFSGVQTINFDNIDTEQVTKLNGMFSDCGNLKKLDLNGFTTDGVTNLSSLFQGCSSLTSLDLSFLNTSKVTSMYQTFNGCKSLISLDLSNWNTGNVTNMYLTFSGCTSLSLLDISNFTFDIASEYFGLFKNVGTDLTNGAYTIIYVKSDYVLNETTYSPQNWILSLDSYNKPSGWSTANVIVKQ